MMIKVKDFSKQTGFSIRMLRYLEEIKILTPLRDTNNYRIYSGEQIKEAQWIKKLQGIGLQLKEIESLKIRNWKEHLTIFTNALKREEEIAEMKSETIPVLKAILSYLETKKGSVQDFYENEKAPTIVTRTVGEGKKFSRTAHSIPILRNIYEDYLTKNANVELIATDLMKFRDWFKDCHYQPDIFSVLNESSFVFGQSISADFILGYEQSWKRFLPEMGFIRLEGFTNEDIPQFMGPHDLVIRTTFKYLEGNIEGEVVIPYAPIYTMSQLSRKDFAK